MQGAEGTRLALPYLFFFLRAFKNKKRAKPSGPTFSFFRLQELADLLGVVQLRDRDLIVALDVPLHRQLVAV